MHTLDKLRDMLMDELANSGEYTEVYGNRSLNTVGLNGTQRPDVIAKDLKGVFHIWEFASKSQSSGVRLLLLQAKMILMQSNNPLAIVEALIPWSEN